MISPSENAGESYYLLGMPSRLPNGALKKKDISRLEFQALDGPEIQLTPETDGNSTVTSAEAGLQDQVAALQEQLKLLTQQAATQLEAAKKMARSESREEWSDELEERVGVERARVAKVCEQFEKQRSRYFADVESEVVKLALEIAARILHREIKMDPLLLSATVRIALEKLADSSMTVLRVPTADLVRWQGVLATKPGSEAQLIGDDQLEPGECVLDTTVGRVELGVKAQLEEIEKGFFDLLQQRPA